MKQVITVLLILIYASIAYTDDVFILGDSTSGNTDNKWKNRSKREFSKIFKD